MSAYNPVPGIEEFPHLMSRMRHDLRVARTAAVTGCEACTNGVQVVVDRYKREYATLKQRELPQGRRPV